MLITQGFNVWQQHLNTQRSGGMKESNSNSKKRTTIWLTNELRNEIDNLYVKDNCSSMTEFITKSIEFYIGFLKQEDNVNYLSPFISELIRAEINGLGQRLSTLIFKSAVETGKLSHMIAAIHNLDEETLNQLHVMCINEVKKINGIISFEDAVKYQSGEK